MHARGLRSTMVDARYQTGLSGGMLETWSAVFERQKAFAEHAFGQLDDAAFFRVPSEGMNSVAIIVRHVAGNLLSRFTDFLTTDGEKDWRDREGEFAGFEIPGDAQGLARLRSEVMERWELGWRTLFETLEGLSGEDLLRTVTIRGVPHAAHAAIVRQIDHYAFHIGQINVIARQSVGSDRWEWFTIPPGGSEAFNERMRRARGEG